jgi:hypothetical protein
MAPAEDRGGPAPARQVVDDPGVTHQIELMSGIVTRAGHPG